MAVVDLGKIRFDWKGVFNDQTPYEARDIVRYNGDIYYFKQFHLGPWNPSDADVMLTSVDVIESEGDLIVGDPSGLNVKLPVDYDFSLDTGADRRGGKALASKSTVSLPTTVTKYLTYSDGGIYFDGVATTSTTYVVTVAQDGGTNKFHLDGVVAPAITMVRGHTYVFDVSDATNASHPLRIKVDGAGGATYSSGITTNGTEGTAGATVTFTVPGNAPDGLRYYCTVHGDAMGNSITVSGGATLTTEYLPNEFDTAVFDRSDASLTGHAVRLSTLPNGIHGGQANTHVSSVTDNNGNTYLQVSSSLGGTNGGGEPSVKQRALYSYVNDSGFSPTYTGTSYPYVYVTGTLTVDPSVTATITQNTLSNGYEVLLVNGRPAYQHTGDDFITLTGLVGGSWLAFDNTGATTSTAFGTASVFSHAYNTNVTYAGTEGTAGSTVTWAIPENAPTVYLYDMTETNPFNTVTVNPTAKAQTATLAYVPKSNHIQTVIENETRIGYVNSAAQMANGVWYDFNQVYMPAGYTEATWNNTQTPTPFTSSSGGTWTTGEWFRPQITLKADAGSKVVLKHNFKMHVAWDHSSKHQGGKIMRRASSDGGQTWGAYERVKSLTQSYTGQASHNDVDFGTYMYTTNAATYVYQGENVVLPFIDFDVYPGMTYQYKVQFKILNNTGYIYLGWTRGYNNQTYSRKGMHTWIIDEVLI